MHLDPTFDAVAQAEEEDLPLSYFSSCSGGLDPRAPYQPFFEEGFRVREFSRPKYRTYAYEKQQSSKIFPCAHCGKPFGSIHNQVYCSISCGARARSNTYTYKGETKTPAEFAEQYNIDRTTLIRRINRGSSIAEAIETPVKKRQKYIVYKDRSQTLSEWAEELGVSKHTLRGRLKRGMTVERAFEI